MKPIDWYMFVIKPLVYKEAALDNNFLNVNFVFTI